MAEGYLQISAGDVSKTLNSAIEKSLRLRLLPRIMNRDAGLFTRSAKLHSLIGNRLGWVDVTRKMSRQVGQIERFGKKVMDDGLFHFVLMGMGGSSLCPEVFGRLFGKHKRLRSYSIVDSTDPAAIRSVLNKIELDHTLFVVASKSGGTIETRSHEAFFLERLRGVGVSNPGRHFAAVTDRGSSLEKFARRNRYRKLFLNPPDIGGRYSALSYFGLVPAFFAGVDLRKLLEGARSMEEILRERPDESNPGLQLAAWMFACAARGRDKMTFVPTERTRPVVPWIEQLVAESTGKQGRGIVPVEGEPTGPARRYGKDRAMIVIRHARERFPLSATTVRDLAREKVPMAEIVLGDKHQVGGQFLLWEAATAAVGRLLGVNPFDEPNVTESKNNTGVILREFEVLGEHSPGEPVAAWGRLSLLAMGGKVRYDRRDLLKLDSLLKRILRAIRPPKYVALLSYFKSDRNTEKAADSLRDVIRSGTGATVLRGYGPRYLHSIGQLYKGGPSNGVFFVLVRQKYGRMPIPGKNYNFGQLIAAQAIGDTQALMGRGLPTMLIALDGSPAAGIRALTQAAARALKNKG
ncbi:MAG: hypothetical protein JSU65_14385 [Candidatus Zixiibacteriota bacterium]|nr:MAG: hypothetical protein JSU65_14385 [candidate division Zixibacteria bacterium]